MAKIHKIAFILFIAICSSTQVFGQIGGQHVYEFLRLPSSARVSALGGSVISVLDDDLALAYHNPAQLNPLQHQRLTFSHNFHFADISNGYFAYAHDLPKLGITAQLGIQYIDYGTFTGADHRDILTGDFEAGETAIVLSAARQMNERIRLGLSIKPIFGNLENYSSGGLAADIGLTYTGSDSSLVIGIVAQNIGNEWDSYTNTKKGTTPFDVQIGLSKRLRYLPFRFSIVGHHLQKWGVRYDDPNRVVSTNLLGETQEQSAFSKGVDNFFRHFVFSGEFLLGRNENLRLRLAYGHLRRKELSVENFRSLAGFSGGIGIKVSKFRLDYGVAYHHLAGATNHITISTGLGEFRKM